MKIAIQQEDTQLLADVLQEQLLAEVPSGNALQVRCAVQNGQLMVLIQHSQGVVFDTDLIFTVLIQALQRQSGQQGQKVQCFVRVNGEKLPYAKQILDIEPQVEKETVFQQEDGSLFSATEDVVQSASLVQEEVPASPSSFGVDSTADSPFGSTSTDDIAESPFGSTSTYTGESSFSYEVNSVTNYTEESSFSSGMDSVTESPFGSISTLEETSSQPFSTTDSLGESPFGSLPIDYDSDSPFDSATIDSLVDSSSSDSPFDSATIDSLVDSSSLDSPFDSATIDSLVDSSFSSTSTQDSPNLSFSSSATDSGFSTSFGSISVDSPDSGTTNSVSDFSFGAASIDSPTDEEISFGSVPLDSFPDSGTSHFGSVPLESFPDSGTFLGQENETEEEIFDPLAGVPNLLEQKKQRTLPPVPILAGLAVGIVVIFGGGGFLLASSCTITECQELQTAKQLQTETPQLIRRVKSARDLVALQEELKKVIAGLQSIPWWSSRHQQAQELSDSFSAQLNNIDPVLSAVQQGTTALQRSKTPAKNIEELKARQNSWRKAIASLEAIKPSNQFYGIVKENLPKYRLNLQTLNDKILSEEKWFNKLTASKKVADSAAQIQAKAKISNDWQKAQTTWQVVVNALKTIPQDSSAYPEAQTLLAEYQPKLTAVSDRATKERLAVQSYQKAINAANLAKAYQQRNQWQAAVTSWQQALQSVKQISNESLYYNEAQPLIETYSTNLIQAQSQLQLTSGLAQTRADLNKACNNNLQFCTFTVDSEKIVVRLTPDYERFVAGEDSNLGVDIQTHFQSLRSALTVISQNANLPLTLYDSKGQEEIAL